MFTFEDVVETVRGLTPHFAPRPLHGARTKARYSDTNYQLLIAIIEAVTGAPIGDAFEERLFRRLGLRHTFLPGRAPLSPTPEPATLWVDSEPFDRSGVLQSVGDVYSTAGDLLLFMRQLVRGEAFADPQTIEMMQSRWIPFGVPLDRAALRSPGWPIEYAHGMMRFRLPRLFTPLAPMPPVFGHTGSTGSWLFYAPTLDLFLCGTVDQATAGAVPYRVVPKILRILQPLSRRGTPS